MDYEIIPTLGPATEPDELLLALRAAGADGFRLNTSHLSLDELQERLQRLTGLFGSPLPVPLVLDLQGSKWRLGQLPAFVLREGISIELAEASATSVADVLPVPHPDFFRAAAESSGEIVLNDARSVLRVETAEPNRIRATVVKGGEISANKGITFSRSDYRKESLSGKDHEIVQRTRGMPGVGYALSYVRDAAEMANYRKALGASAPLIAKLERASALDDADAIAGCADELWLCRGDLGAEIGPRAMAETVHRFSRRVRSLPVPVLLAGQVLEHMTASPAPTRSELCYLYDALQAGFRGVVLSDETAIGRYPIEACRAAALFRDAAS